MYVFMLIFLLLMILQFLLLQNYFNKQIDKQTEKVELLLKNASIMEIKMDEVKNEIKEINK